MSNFYTQTKEDLRLILTDEVVFFEKTVKVKVFESIDDPSTIHKSGGEVPLYLIGIVDDFEDIEVGQRILIGEKSYSINAFRKSITGAINIYIHMEG